MRVLLLGPRGQLGHDVRRAHEEAEGSFELSSLARGALDVSAPENVEQTLGGLDFDALAFAVNAHVVRAMARACAARRARFFHSLVARPVILETDGADEAVLQSESVRAADLLQDRFLDRAFQVFGFPSEVVEVKVVEPREESWQ